MPLEDGTSEGAYERSVKAKGYDLIRGLLPAATQTNMGVFGNGRFFETLIRRMNVNELTELREMGQSAFKELSKVIPSFIRRADLEHPHFQDFKAFSRERKELIAGFLNGSSPVHQQASGKMEVELVDYDPEADIRVIAGMLYPYTDSSMEELFQMVRNLKSEEKRRLLEDCVARRKHRRHKPGRELEMPYYTFDLVGDYGMYRDLQRHRMLTQDRQPLSTHYGYE